ncbi:alpha/beta fold hydrolase [Bifidobacterium xylocopae]|uniref:Proline iminopeptidase n=1 Tax=Bifidobacterium xylocopae TaxID=2493119 RepID=A0A366KEZ7_9BIFI|nr:alpha/beta fold hydrolase [Bifidobacterium xylocopae]RBQ00140.1 proline iminopeptidase [Bifidobacterium xylocopae]
MEHLESYSMPGMHVEEGSIPVPLDWEGLDPGDDIGAGPRLRLFYRVLTAPGRIHDDLPLLVFLQGGPGGAGPRPLTPQSDPWIAEALRHFRVVLPDQRGTGRSSAIDGTGFAAIGGPGEQAAYLRRFLAGSIVRDFEHLRRTVFGGRRWLSLGQSYGGFLTLAYLSAFPEGLAACFTTGGIPHVPADASEVYEHTFPRMKAKTQAFYDRYPQDRQRVAAVADILAEGGARLPGGDPLTVERFQTLGSDFGMKPCFERLHWLLDTAFPDGDGSLKTGSTARLSDIFLAGVDRSTASAPLYWPLQEFIYADGECGPIDWAAQRVRDQDPSFSPDGRPLMFTGEAIFPWMFEQERNLRPFRQAVQLLMQEGTWPRIYDPERLAGNEVPLQAAVYYNDMYVDRELQMDTLSRIGSSHAWVTSGYEHDGLHEGGVFSELLAQAMDRGGLDGLL